MSPVLIAQLLATFGPGIVSVITSLIAKIEAGGVVSSAEWATLTTAVQQTAKQRMALALAAAGIDPTSAQGVALLNAAS